jgi:hypothetical protein
MRNLGVGPKSKQGINLFHVHLKHNLKTISFNVFSIRTYMFFSVLVIEPRDSHMLGNLSTTWPIPLAIFAIGSHELCPGWPWTFLIVRSSPSASPVAGIIGMSHHTWLCLHFDFYPSYDIRCGIFHLWHRDSAQKILDLGTFCIFELGVLTPYYSLFYRWETKAEGGQGGCLVWVKAQLISDRCLNFNSNIWPEKLLQAINLL